jgi:hypothetical protein
MDYYILRNKQMPWGDYGNILYTGLLTTLDKNYNDLEYPELERTGPYIPDMYIANSIDLVIVDNLKDIIEKSKLTGIKKYQKIIKKKIVGINWTEWDMKNKKPLFYPKGNEPENYILKNENNEELKNQMPDVWKMIIEKEYTLKKISENMDNINFTDIALTDIPEKDIFVPNNMLFIIVSENFKKTMDKNNIGTLEYKKIGVMN